MRASVVMPAWITDSEGLTLTTAAIESLQHKDVEIIVVDNGSTIGGGLLRQMSHVYLRLPNNLGFVKAINHGIRLASSNLIALANNDIRVSPNWLEVAEEILKDPLIASVHPKMQDYDEPFKLGDQVIPEGKERWCQNSFVITKSSVLAELALAENGTKLTPGVFDEGFEVGGGGDDWDFYIRLRKLGYKTCYTNKIAFQHHHSFTQQKLGSERERVIKQNDEYFTKKWGKTKEQIFLELYPEQMAKNWREGFI